MCSTANPCLHPCRVGHGRTDDAQSRSISQCVPPSCLTPGRLLCCTGGPGRRAQPGESHDVEDSADGHPLWRCQRYEFCLERSVLRKLTVFEAKLGT